MPAIHRLLASVSSIAFIAACGGNEPPPTPETDAATERALSQGKIVGFRSEDGAHVWRNIPFGHAPVGALRWRAPQPAGRWEGTRTAVEWGERPAARVSCRWVSGSTADAYRSRLP